MTSGQASLVPTRALAPATPVEDQNDHRLPEALVVFVASACIVPYLFPLAGVHLIPVDTDGALVHSLLEWSAVCVSLFTAFLGLLYYRVRAEPLVLTIALAALVSGLWDALHAMASLGLVRIHTELSVFLPFTWAISRTARALLLMVGALFIIFFVDRRTRVNVSLLVSGALTVVLVALAFSDLTLRESLPAMEFPNAIIKRPWDIPPLLLIVINGFVLFPLLVKRYPTILARALLLSAGPDAVAGATMAFGSAALYDHPFQVAHFLKLTALLVPAVGISLYFIRAFRREQRVADRLERAVSELTNVEKELRIKEAHLDQLTDNIREVFWLSSADGSEMFYVSPAYEDIFGLSCESLYERSDSFLEVVHPVDRELFTNPGQRDSEEEFEVEFRILRRDGEVRWLRTRGFRFRDAEGDVSRLAGLTEDVTESKLAGEALRKSEARNRALLEAMPDLMLLLDRHGTILDYHARDRTPLYKPPTEFLGRHVTDVHPEFSTRIMEAVTAALGGSMPLLEYRMVVGDYERDYEARFVKSADDEVLAVIRDITEQKRLEREVLDVSNREQHRIGHDLHDGISQQLTGIALLCKALHRKLASDSRPEATEAEQIEELVDDVIVQTRSLARGLAPVQLEEGGLCSALEELAEGIETRFPVKCRFHCSEEVPTEDYSLATHLYRIAQEAVNNALKHGHPASIAIDLVSSNGRSRLAIEDDGSGFDPETTGSGMGLHIMRYRARMIDATLNIAASPSRRGTVVSCEWTRSIKS